MSQNFFITTEPASWIGNDSDTSFDTNSNQVWGKSNGVWSLVLDPDDVGTVAWGNVTGTLSAQTDLQTALNLKADKDPVPNVQAGTTYTLALSDDNKMITLNNASAITLTVPLNATIALPLGYTVGLFQLGAGQVTVAAEGGVTIRSLVGLKLSAQYAPASLTKIAANLWALSGSLAA